MSAVDCVFVPFGPPEFARLDLEHRLTLAYRRGLDSIPEGTRLPYPEWIARNAFSILRCVWLFELHLIESEARGASRAEIKRILKMYGEVISVAAPMLHKSGMMGKSDANNDETGCKTDGLE
jgi:hypothetical protein